MGPPESYKIQDKIYEVILWVTQGQAQISTVPEKSHLSEEEEEKEEDVDQLLSDHLPMHKGTGECHKLPRCSHRSLGSSG